jgi:ectoine hydroxylase-related dioxygenase (phytanoyl-CoA dioxygenase family)
MSTTGARLSPETHNSAETSMIEPMLELNEQQLESFDERGFIALEALADREELAEIRKSLESLFEKKAGIKEGALLDLINTGGEEANMNSPQIINPVNYAPGLHKTKCAKNALRIARQILGPDARLIWDMAILKKARKGEGTPWHQDEASRDPGFNYHEVSIWVPMHDVSVEGSCLKFIPGSHRIPVMPHHSLNDDPSSHALQCRGEFDEATAVSCPIPAGGCTIHDQRTLHCSGPNIIGVPRLAYIMVFGTPPTPTLEPRSFPWLDEKKTVAQARKRRWMLRGGFFITAWRKIRRGEFNGQLALYSLKRSIRMIRSGW